ncbi:Chromosome partition protein Smc [Tepidimonas alkaliphilus]|uniref:Chromosome partition protein Smc n=1 Tax=Tepidimonas alkaliphilus TaxID=2588942 RepID=A0A554WAD1_9BURK|nr:chromosome segregation protein SMC [Tepidimonas alkaliphilus]TSE20535.1 Chromosome partition protein Smc [Tepidimonas alkaliphilus]
MRLQTIKLSGFKSFAEPTTIQLPGQLVGVVGPNGCGKSNIIDAVRWVLGESRASELRGETMQDVIFNGTTTRKPAQRASVELVFDNSARRASGPWNAYAEIAVRRVLTRDGASSYFINNQPVRRRDVQDVFMGTGLGPRAYAIIGQGTISRIIESRPEELRLFLEEAAGVSKYKERRRETAARLADTRDNLTRVEDILRELQGQLQRLQAQAEVAQRYQQLQAQLQRRQQQLWWLKAEEAQAQRDRVRAQGGQAVAALEQQAAQLQLAQAQAADLRQAQQAAAEALHRAQGRVYEAGAEVARLHAELRFAAQSRQQAEQRCQSLQQQLNQWVERAALAGEEEQALQAQQEEAAEEAERLAAQIEELQPRLEALQQARAQAQAQLQQRRARVHELQRELSALAAEQRGLLEQRQAVQARYDRAMREAQRAQAPDPQHLRHWQVEEQAAAEALAQAQARLAHLQEEALPAADEARAAAERSVREEAAREADLQARYNALRALHDKLQHDERLHPWLRAQGLDGLRALWHDLPSDTGWETALEAALRERVRALPVQALDALAGLRHDPPPARLAFYARGGAAGPSSKQSPPGGCVPLAEHLRLHDAALHAVLADWLHGCWAAPDLTAALSARAALAAGERIYTPQGHSVGRFDVVFYAADEPQAGLLARAHELEQLQRAAHAQALVHEQARLALQRADARLAELRAAQESARRDLAQAQQRHHGAQLERLRAEQALREAERHAERLQAERAELEQTLQELQQRAADAQARLEASDQALAEAQEALVQAEDEAAGAEAALQRTQEQMRVLERRAQEADFACRSLAQRRDELRRTQTTAEAQQRELSQQLAALQAELQRHDDPALEQALQAALQRQSEAETALAACRSRHDDLAAQLRAAEEQRLRAEQALEPLRQRITELQLQEQAAELARQQHAQALAETGADPEAVAASIVADGVRASALPGEIERLQRDIAALGAVNLAALEELGAAREREQFLRQQSDDLRQAIATLEDAIRRIDQETRDLLAQTFHTVNEHFGRMFPELFGGGQARLIMTGEEILDAGVQVMAQPPGKRNQTIHLLSGGEKALTAIALVFAIFQLNPAPFCLLDEVDAPLDDANTERYARLVTRMSRDTQFLFISHNRIAMEMAQQLIGVTMQEQGVSRIVAVDLQQAVSMMDNAAP